MLNILTLALASLVTPGQPLSVTACGADPSGKTDSTAAFTQCLAALPAGNLIIPYGTYVITKSIVKKRNQNLIGMGSNASILKCEMLTAPCIVAADTTGGPNNYNASKLQDLGLQGLGAEGIGVLLGGDPNGQFIASDAFGDGVSFDNVRITGFGHGIQWGNNAWGNKIGHSAIFGNTVGLFIPSGLGNSGEGTGITETGIFNNGTGIDDNANFEWFIQGSAFDYNSTAFIFFGATIHATHCHFEQPTGQVFLEPYGYGSLSIKDSTILIQANTGFDKYILNLWPQSIDLSIDNVSVWSNHSVNYFMRSDGNTTGTITNVYGNGNKMISSLAEGGTKAVQTSIQAFQ